MTNPLHEDRIRGRAFNPDGKRVRNLSVGDYDALYDQGEPCHAEHADLIAQAEAELDEPLPDAVPPWAERTAGPPVERGDNDSE